MQQNQFRDERIDDRRNSNQSEESSVVLPHSLELHSRDEIDNKSILLHFLFFINSLHPLLKS